MTPDEVKDDVEEEALKDLAKGVEQGDGTIGRGICLAFARFKDGNNFCF